MFDRHDEKPLNPCDSVHESTGEASECKSIIDWSHNNPSEEDVHKSLALTEEDCAFEEKMSELVEFKAPDGSGRRILKAVFAQTGIEREPMVHMSKFKIFTKKAFQIISKLWVGIIVLISTIVAFSIVLSALWNWRYLGDPEALVQSKEQIALRLKEVGTLDRYDDVFTEKPLAREVNIATKSYMAALMLMDFPHKYYSIKFDLKSLTSTTATTSEKSLSHEIESYSLALEAYKEQANAFTLINKANNRDWSFDEVQPEVHNFIDGGRPWGDEYYHSQQKLEIATRINGVLSIHYFSKNKADKAAKHLISGLRLSEFMRTTGSVHSFNDSALRTLMFLLVLDRNIEKIRTIEKTTMEQLKVVLKGQKLMSAIRRSAATNAYFEATSLIQLFGILNSKSNLSLIGANDSWTTTLAGSRMLKWMARPLLVNDAGTYMIYKARELETIWHITRDDRLLEERIGKANDQTFEKLRDLRSWWGAWAETLENKRSFSVRYYTGRYNETDYRFVIHDWLPTHRKAQKLLAQVEQIDN